MVMDYSKLPVMKVDQVAYNARKESGFRRFPDRKQNFIKLRNNNKSVLCDYMPAIVCIEPVARCNFQCIMCDLQTHPNRKRGPDLSLEDFKTLIDSLPSLVEIKLNGAGEPLLNPHNS